MMKIVRFLGILLLVLIVFLPLNTIKTYAYTLNDLGAYIENPEFHDSQQGRADGNLGLYQVVGDKQVVANVKAIYFDSTNKTFQILARRYNPTIGIDKTSNDMKWSVVDERICTVDSNGFVTAGNTTGATIVIMEDDTCCMSFTVVNRTGKYDNWYEDMFKDIHTLSTVYGKKDFKNVSSAKLACEYLGNGYKILVDAYLTHGSALNTDPEVRLGIIQEAVKEVIQVSYLTSAKGDIWGDCVLTAAMTSIICDPFTINTNAQRFGCDMINLPGHVTNAILLDGIVYNVDNGNFQEVAKETDWIWINDVLNGSYVFIGNSISEAEISCKKSAYNSFTRDRDEIAKCLKQGVNSK